MSDRLDLNQLRDVLVERAPEPDKAPKKPTQRVFVTSSGKIVQGEPQQLGSQPLSEVHPAVFATTSRLERDAAIVREKLPANARFHRSGHVEGWLYDFTSEYGDPYTMYVFWHAATGLYRVTMVWPEPPGPTDSHTSHLFDDGCLCLSPEWGMPTLEMAYAKSVLFATGWSVFARVGEFPFPSDMTP